MRFLEKELLPRLSEPATLTRGKKLSRKLKRQADAINRAAESWRSEEIITSRPILLNVNGVNVLVERTLAYNLLASREAKIVADLDARVDMIAVE